MRQASGPRTTIAAGRHPLVAYFDLNGDRQWPASLPRGRVRHHQTRVSGRLRGSAGTTARLRDLQTWLPPFPTAHVPRHADSPHRTGRRRVRRAVVARVRPSRRATWPIAPTAQRLRMCQRRIREVCTDSRSDPAPLMARPRHALDRDQVRRVTQGDLLALGDLADRRKSRRHP